MKLDTAKAAVPLIAQIEAQEAKLAHIDLVIAENWPVTMVQAVAPAEGASMPEGTTVNLATAGKAGAVIWKLAVSTARDEAQSVLDELKQQLEAL